jgi:hypothetical protein
MRRAISLALLLIAAASCAGASSSQVTLPDWVQKLASQPTGTYPPRTDAVVLLDQLQVFLVSPTEYQEHKRRVVRILRPEGRDQGKFSVAFRPGEKVTNIHAWSINAAGHTFELKDKDFLTMSPYGTDELYNDDMVMGGEVSGADIGSVIAFEYTIVRHPLANQLGRVFQETVPVAESRLSVTLPAGWEFKTFWANGAPIEPNSLGNNSFEWIKRDIPAIVDEELSPTARALASRMSIAFYQPSGTKLDSWQAIGAWNNMLTADRRVPTPEIADKAKQLAAGKSGFDATLRPIANFLQRDVRYVAIEIGIGGNQPHFAADVFRHRYGDCKDKATLLAAMLQSIGIGSHYVLIDSDHGETHEEMPSTSAFDHEILAIDLPVDAPSYRSVITTKSGKKYLVFDPTDEFTPVGELNAALQGNFGLLSLESGGELVRLPLLEPDSNRRERNGTFTLNTDGNLIGEVVEKRNGQSAWYWRSAMMRSTDSDRTRYIERYFEHSLKGISIKESKLENIDLLTEDLVSRYKLTADRYAQNQGPLLLLRPRVLGSLNMRLDWKERKYPVHLGSPEREVDTYEIQLPEGYVVDDMPEPVKIDVGFASYQSRYENTGKAIRYWREYVVKDPFVPNDKLADLHRLQDHIGRDEFSTVVLQKK